MQVRTTIIKDEWHTYSWPSSRTDQPWDPTKKVFFPVAAATERETNY